MLTLNKKALKKIVILLICFTIFFASNAKAVVKPTSNFYVNDYAGLLNEETKNYIMNANISLNSKTGAQIVVVTVTSLEGQSLEEYATEVFREFGIGDKDKNNGLLLLLALEEREFRVEVGYGLEGILPDAKTGRIQDEYIIPYLKNDNWNDGIKNGFKKHNFYGIPENINERPDNYGIYEFKKGFNGYVEELIGEYELPLSIHYYLFKIIHKLKEVKYALHL